MLENIEESLPKTTSSNNPSTRNISLLKIRKNSQSTGEGSINRLITIYYYDQSKEITHELKEEFNESLQIGDLIQWTVRRLNRESQTKLQANNVQFFLPKKKLGMPKDDFPSFRNEIKLKDCNQTKFAIKVTMPIIPEMREVSSEVKTRTSYNNSLVRKSMSDQKNKQQKSSFYCLCFNNND